MVAAERQRINEGGDPSEWCRADASTWRVDSNLQELTYPQGTWWCVCGSAVWPTKGELTETCTGYRWGEKCLKSHKDGFVSWAGKEPGAVITPESSDGGDGGPAGEVLSRKTHGGRKKIKSERKAEAWKELEEAAKAEGWKCGRCTGLNLPDRTVCYKCSFPKGSTVEPGSSSTAVRRSSRAASDRRWPAASAGVRPSSTAAGAAAAPKPSSAPPKSSGPDLWANWDPTHPGLKGTGARPSLRPRVPSRPPSQSARPPSRPPSQSSRPPSRPPSQSAPWRAQQWEGWREEGTGTSQGSTWRAQEWEAGGARVRPSRTRAPAPRKYDARESEQNHPYAHLIGGQATWAVGMVMVGVLTKHSAVLVGHSFERATEVVDTAADAAIFVIDSVADTSLNTLRHCVFATIVTGFVFVSWFAALKLKLRLAGFEPEANVVFSAGDVWSVVRSAKRVEALLDKVRLLHRTEEALFLTVQGSEVRPYEVELSLPLLYSGASPQAVVVKCACMDHVQRGPVCKHAGAACLYVRSHLSEVSQVGFSGPALVDVDVATRPAAGVASSAARGAAAAAFQQRIAVFQEQHRQHSHAGASGLGCFEGLREKARKLGSRARSIPDAAIPAEAPVQVAALATPATEEMKKKTKEQASQTDGKPGSTFLTGIEAQQYAQATLIGHREEIRSVHVVAYSFDVEGITEALCDLGPSVHVLMDRGQCFGRTRRQLQRAQQLVAHGCKVRVGTGFPVREAYRARDREVRVGEDVRGIIHGKSLLIEMTPPHGTLCLIGSTNWTDSSTANVEFSAVIRHVDAPFRAAWLEEFHRGWNSSADVGDALTEADQRGYGRRSVSRSNSQSMPRGY